MPERALTFSVRLGRIPSAALLVSIRVYQRFLSPALRIAGGPLSGCRFAPTCSHYAAEAVVTHGALTGAWLAACRLVKCTPLHPGGFDPVPAPRGPICVRIRPESVTPHPSPSA